MSVVRALAHFKKADPVLYAAAKDVKIKPLKPRPPEDYFKSLCFEIINQQLNGKVARTIFARFEALFRKGVTPGSVNRIKVDRIRSIGASWSKAEFIKDLAKKVCSGELDLRKLKRLDNKSAIEQLTSVKGIGPWTAEMFLMFTIGREDLFSHGDLGLRKGVEKLYGLTDKAQIEKLSQKWSPYRTYACRVLWGVND